MMFSQNSITAKSIHNLKMSQKVKKKLNYATKLQICRCHNMIQMSF